MADQPTVLLSLTDREAIIDPLYRAVLGVDAVNESLLESAFSDDIIMSISGRPPVSGKEAMRKAFSFVANELDTTHFLTNFRVVHSPGEETAEVMCSALAQHYRKGEGVKQDAKGFLTGGLYSVECVKDGSGLWKMRRWDVKVIWTEGDGSVLARPQ